MIFNRLMPLWNKRFLTEIKQYLSRLNWSNLINLKLNKNEILNFNARIPPICFSHRDQRVLHLAPARVLRTRLLFRKNWFYFLQHWLVGSNCIRWLQKSVRLIIMGCTLWSHLRDWYLKSFRIKILRFFCTKRWQLANLL